MNWLRRRRIRTIPLCRVCGYARGSIYHNRDYQDGRYYEHPFQRGGGKLVAPLLTPTLSELTDTIGDKHFDP